MRVGNYGFRSPVGSGRYTATSNAQPSGVPNGTPGGISLGGIGVSPAGRRPGMKLTLGDEGYLWVLVGIEVACMALCRNKFRRHHGG